MRLWLVVWLFFPLAHAQEVGRLLLLSFTGTEPPLERLEALHPAGFIFFASNVVSLEHTRATTRKLQAAAPYPLLLGVDQEGGSVSSFRTGGATLFPGNMALGAAGDPVLARRVGEAVGRELAHAGLNLNFAPVVDVATNPDNPVIGVRSFGSNPAAVAHLGAAFAAGLERAGVAAVAKHFPGHGDTDTDSHLTLPVVGRSRAGLADLELVPFKALIDAGVPAVMSAHVVFAALDDLPATLSRPILTRLLRRELGFGGVLVTDALNMRAVSERYSPGEAAVRSVRAGADLLLLVGDEATQNEVYRALQEALRSGRLSRARVREAVSRVTRLARRYPLKDVPRPDLTAHRALAHKVARRAATLLWNDGVLPIKPSQKVVVVAPYPGGYGRSLHLGSVLKRHHEHVRSVVVSERPTETQIEEAANKASSADVVVLASYYRLGNYPMELAQLGARLSSTCKPLVLVSIGNPGDANFLFTEPQAYLSVYGYREANLAAASDALLGRIVPQGRLPVPFENPFVGPSMEERC